MRMSREQAKEFASRVSAGPYDGMEQREALYEWNHAAQLLHMRAAASQTGSNATPQDIEREVYQKRFLVKRPLLEALQTLAPGALLLIDEVDSQIDRNKTFAKKSLEKKKQNFLDLVVE